MANTKGQIEPQLELPLHFSSSTRRKPVFKIYDLSDPEQCYDLARRICAEGQKNGSQFYWDSPTPVVIRIPTKNAQFVRYNFQDVLREGNINFMAYDAIGNKNGEQQTRKIFPSLVQATQGAFNSLKKSDDHIEIVTRNLYLAPQGKDGLDSYALSIRESFTDKMSYIAQRVKSRTTPSCDA